MFIRYLLLYRLLLFAGLFFTFTPCAGQVSVSVRTEPDSLYRYISREMSAEYACHFTYAQGSGVIAPGLGNNAAELEKLDRFVRQALSHPTLFISRFRLTGYCSVEGGYARNESLAQERVDIFYHYLREHYPALYRYPYDRAWVGEDWDGLARAVKASPLNEREEVLAVIRRNPVYDTREALLTKLNGGRPWLFMEREVFPKLRRVELRIEYTTVDTQKTSVPTASPQPSPKEREPEPDPLIYRVLEDTISTNDNSQMTIDNYRAQQTAGSQLSTAGSSGEGWGEAVPRFVLKTNLLLLAGVQPDFTYTTPVLNGALEYYISDHWSVEAGAAYSYWQYHSRREFQGVSGYRLEPRYRLAFPNDRFGAYLGAYGRFGDYDIRKTKISVDRGNPVDDNYDAQPAAGSERSSTFSFTGRYWDAGLSAGFTIRLVGGLGLEVGARAGYIRSSPKEYIYRDGQKWFDSHWKYHKLGVTDLNVSLIYTIQPHPGPLPRRGR